MAIINLDSPPINSDEFSDTFDQWITNTIDAIQYNFSCIQLEQGLRTVSSGTSITQVVDFPSISVTTEDLPRYFLHAYLQQASPATNYIASITPSVFSGALRFTVTLGAAKDAGIDLLIKYKLEAVQ